MILVPARHHGKWLKALPRQTILMWRCEERWSVLLWSRDFLTASFFSGCLARRVAPWSLAPWLDYGVLLGRWRRCSLSYVTHGRRQVRQRARWCRRLSGGADELGDAVQPVLVEVVGGR